MPKLPIPAGFGQSGKTLEDAKQVIVAQSMAFAASKGKFTKLMKSVAGTKIITAHHKDGSTSQVEVFGKPNIGPAMKNPESEAVEMLELMIGMDDEARQEMYDVYAQDGVKSLILNWKTRQYYELDDWKKGLKLLALQMVDIDTIELVGCNISYGEHYTEDPLQRVPKRIDRFKDIQKILNEAGTDEQGFDYPRYPPNTNVVLDIMPEYVMGSLEQGVLEVTLRDSLGNDITDSIKIQTRKAIASLIVSNNGNFVEWVSTTKLSEKEIKIIDGYPYQIYYEVRSKDIFKASILPTFEEEINHLNNTFPHRHPKEGITRDVPKGEASGLDDYLQYKHYYLADFWIFRDKNWADFTMGEQTNDLFVYDKRLPQAGELFFNTGALHLAVDKFNKVSQKDYFEYVTNLISIDVETKDSSGCCGIGGFVGDLLGTFVNMIGAIAGTATELVLIVLKVTGQYYLLKAIGFSEQNIELIARVIATIVLTIITAGVSEYMQIANTAAKLGTAYSTFVASELSVSLIVHLGIETTIANFSTNTILTVVEYAGKLAPLAGMRIGETRQGESSIEEQEEAEQNIYNKGAGLAGDESEKLRELNYNPFARQELARLQRYPSMQEKPNPLDNLMT